ncbi:MAG: autotransporter-associated beta strand repeat-containing protein, partial [Verrucomicrobia bacterium]|nr:autotransporter-associated beta strand repeat-containing protein [Verrucomicrobiota bacterium]
YDRSVYGYTLSTVKPFANALVDVMNIATNSFSGAVDGTGTAQNYMQQQWLWLADLRSSAYDVVAQADYASGRYKSDPYMVAAILWMKNRRQQEFAVTPTPISQTIPVGGATNFTLVVAPLGGSTNAVSLTVTGLPSGATGAFNAPTVNLAALDYVSTNVTLSITTSASTPAGVYPLTITSANGSATHTNTLTLVLGNYALSVSPPSQAVSAGNGTSYTITVTTNAGFSGIVSFGLTGLPANTSAGFSPGSLNGAGGSILTVTTATNAASGDYTLTVNGTNGAEIASVTMNLAIVGATPVWNGGSASDNYWSDPANWSSNGLVPGTLLVFSGNARLNNTNDTAAGTAYSNIVFNSGAGAFTLNGNSILLAGNITNDSPALETVALPIDFTNNVTLDGDGGPLAITGGLTNTLGGAGSTTLTLAGTGTLDDSLGSAYNPGGTNTLSLNSASADWTIANNPSATPINTGPWVMQISAGTLNFGNGADAPNLDLNMAVSRQDNFVGSAGGLTGTLNIASGTLTTVSRWDTGGFNSGSDGIIAQSGGTFNVGSQLQGANVAGGASTITVSGGIMNIANGGGQFYVASRGTGTLTVSGSGQVACGILDVSRNASGNSAGSAGVVNLDGGILTCSRVGTATANAQTNTLNGTSATFNFNGGTLAAAASSTNFFQGSAVLPILPISAIVKGGGAVINDGGNAITVLDPLQHDSSLGGDLDGGLTKLGAGTLTLTGTNTYNGDTVIAAGTMALSGGGSIGGSDSITVSGGATLDASARADGTLTLAAGQTLTGSGAVNGNVVVGSGATLAPGGALNTLTFNNNLTLNGGSTTVFEASKSPTTNDFARAAGTVTLGGTIVITNISANAYAAGDSFQLFSAAGYAGMFTNIQPAIPGLNLAWNTNNLGAGTLSIVSSPTPQPQISAVTMRGGNFSFSATNGVPGWPCGVLASTNVALPLNQWTAIGTNHFDGSGNFTFTNAPDPAVPHTFYLLRLQ